MSDKRTFANAGAVVRVQITEAVLHAFKTDDAFINQFRHAVRASHTTSPERNGFDTVIADLRDKLLIPANYNQIPSTRANGVDDTIDAQRQADVLRKLKQTFEQEEKTCRFNTAEEIKKLAHHNAWRDGVPEKAEMPTLSKNYDTKNVRALLPPTELSLAIVQNAQKNDPTFISEHTGTKPPKTVTPSQCR